MKSPAGVQPTTGGVVVGMAACSVFRRMAKFHHFCRTTLDRLSINRQPRLAARMSCTNLVSAGTENVQHGSWPLCMRKSERRISINRKARAADSLPLPLGVAADCVAVLVLHHDDKHGVDVLDRTAWRLEDRSLQNRATEHRQRKGPGGRTIAVEAQTKPMPCKILLACLKQART